MNDHVVDFVIRLKNAAMARRKEVIMPYAKLVEKVARVLVAERFLTEVRKETIDEKQVIVAVIRYTRQTPALSDITVISKPSLRKYVPARELRLQKGRGLGVTILSTSSGILTGKEAALKHVGGQVLFTIW